MIFVFAIGLCALTLFSLRGGLVAEPGRAVHSLDTTGVVLALAAFGAAAFYLGPVYGIALTLSIMIHEFGHVAAFRVAGHTDARFRLIPLMGGVAISNSEPDSDLKDFFITLMGPGICIAPVVLACVLAEALWDIAPQFAYAMWIFASVTGALNFVNLLPFWPLDGGRCLQLICRAFWPPLGPYLAIAMSAASAAAALWMHSAVLFVVAILGARGLLAGPLPDLPRRPMTLWQGVEATAAYVFVTGCHLAAGLWVLAGLLN